MDFSNPLRAYLVDRMWYELFTTKRQNTAEILEAFSIRYNGEFQENDILQILDELEEIGFVERTVDPVLGKYYKNLDEYDNFYFTEREREGSLFWRASEYGDEVYKKETELNNISGLTVDFIRHSSGASLDSDSQSYYLFRDRLFASIKTAEEVFSLNYVSVENVTEVYSDEIISVTWINRALEDLEALRLVEILLPPSSYSQKEIRISLTETGYKYYWDTMPSEQDSLNEKSASIPASDRTVSLNHNSDEYKKAITSLDKVILEFRKDHRLDNELGKEKDALLGALEAGRALFEDLKVNITIAIAIIVEPLKRIVQKYDHALVGASASVALALILKMLGIG